MTGDVGKLYSTALFELSGEENTFDEVHSQLNEYNDIFKDNPDFVKFLSSPGITFEEKHEVLLKVFDDDSMVFDFICLVTEKGRISYIDRITSEFNKLYYDRNNIAEMTVTTSTALKPELKEKLISKLEEKSGKKVRLIEKVDPDILGGLIIRYGNSEIDNSVKGKLEAVAEQLKLQ